MVPFMPVHFNL